MNNYDDIGIQVPQIYLPSADVDPTRWAVIACDQFTSQPEYWREVEAFVGRAPSTYHLILPEVQLGTPGEAGRIRGIQSTMRSYLEQGILRPSRGMLYVERKVDGRSRRGLMLCLDLERYDFSPGSTSLIRATEGTIVERLPARVEIRRDAALELPHILVLVDDPGRTVIEPLEQARDGLEKVYDFDLMFDSGHLTGYAVPAALEERVAAALRNLADPRAFAARYGVGPEQPVLLFAMGDGNHSLATAKSVWEELKPQVGPDHPARYALVELENVHDAGLAFEPIHRLLFGLKGDVFAALEAHFGADCVYLPLGSAAEMVARVDGQQGPCQVVGVVGGGRGFGLLEISNPGSNLPVGTLQAFLDPFLERGGAGRIDYVHGEEVVCTLGAQAGNAGFYVPGMDKSDLFKTVILDGALPRKTFSMGEAREKRFYMECRKIT